MGVGSGPLHSLPVFSSIPALCKKLSSTVNMTQSRKGKGLVKDLHDSTLTHPFLSAFAYSPRLEYKDMPELVTFCLLSILQAP